MQITKILKLFIIFTSLFVNPAFSTLIIDEYKIDSISVFEPSNSCIEDFNRYYFNPLIKDQCRSWSNEDAKVTDFDQIVRNDTQYEFCIEIDGSLYTLRIVDTRYGHDEIMMEEEFIIECKGEVIYRGIGRGWPTDWTIKAFFAWESNWIVEHFNHVVVSGQDLNEELGYDKIFHYRIMDNRIFYFFEKDGVVRISFDGQIQPNQYDKIHHYWCCSPFMFNPTHYEYYVTFFAIKDGYWYYVEAGVEE